MIRQLGFQAMCTHNPSMETCDARGCDVVLFGEVYVMQFEFEDEVRTFELCSLRCYQLLDARIEAEISEDADFIAMIDGGIPDDWGEKND